MSCRRINSSTINLNCISAQISLCLQKLHNTLMSVAKWCLTVKCGIQLENHGRLPTLACAGGWLNVRQLQFRDCSCVVDTHLIFHLWSRSSLSVESIPKQVLLSFRSFASVTQVCSLWNQNASSTFAKYRQRKM